MEVEVKKGVVIKPVERKTQIKDNKMNSSRFPNTKTRLVCPIDLKTKKRVTGYLPEHKDDYASLNLPLDNDMWWATFTIILNADETILNLDNPMDLLKYRCLLANNLVANSKAEVNIKSIYYMYDEVSEAKKSNQGRAKKIEACGYIAKMSAAERTSFLKLFGKRTDSMVQEVIDDVLGQLAETKSEEFCNLYKDPNKDMRIHITDCIQYGVLRKKGELIYNEDVLLGSNMDDAIEYLKAKANQETLIATQKLLKSKKEAV